MDRYEVVIQDVLNSYILDKKDNVIVALCATKRPDLGFDKLKELVKQANAEKYIGLKVRNKNSGEIGVILRITDSGSIQVLEKITPYVLCTHDNWNTLEILD